MKTSARLSAAFALGVFVSAAPLAASAQMALNPAVAFKSGTSTVTVRANASGGVTFWATRHGMQVSGQIAAADLEAWTRDAEKLFVSGPSSDEQQIGGVLGAKSELKTPWLFASNKSVIALDRLRRAQAESFNLYVTDANNENPIYIPIPREEAHALVEALRDAAGTARQMAIAAEAGPSDK
jgi:hypothetical protein